MAAVRGSLVKIKDETVYYPHQTDGIRKLARIASFLLADEMGLGKSLQSLTVAAIDFELGYAERVLVVAPATLKWNWQDEIKKFTNFSCQVLDGSPLQREGQIIDFVAFKRDILIVNYEQVAPHLDMLNGIGFDIIIWDEAHYLKNPTAARTKASLKLRAGRKFLLTGSPMLNNVNEFWSIMHLINPVEFPSYKRFCNKYCTYGGFKGKQIVGVKNKVQLMNKIESVMTRRLKKDVLDLPDKQYITIPVDLHPEQKKLYDQAQNDLKIIMPDGVDDKEIDNALVKYTYLKEICGSTFKFTGEDHSSKLDRATEMAMEITRTEPTVVFTQFRPIIQCLHNRIDAAGGKIFQLHGDVPMESRSEVVKQWATWRGPNGECATLIAGLQVAGVGLNMTAASKCIFVDKLYVPKLNEQAEDRLHRIGASTTQPIQIFHIIARRTVEQRIEAILRHKRELFSSLVDPTDWKRAIAAALAEDDEGYDD